MNAIFAADLVLYLVLLPLVFYIVWTRRSGGLLAWYYLSVFCIARVVGGAMGVHDSQSLAANIIVGVGISPLILAIDGLLHEARAYRNPGSQWVGWAVVIVATGLMATALALAIVGALNIYEGHPKADSLDHWKTGTGLMVLVWGLEVIWACIQLLPSQRRKDAFSFHAGTTLLQGSFLALFFVGIRAIYQLVAVCTQRKDLSSSTGSLAVRVVLVFLPEAFTVFSMVLVGVQTRNVRKG
ncbi:integral membrane protein [Aspergillus uvarum CBS 121591]|uniref:Integral membrane protein n=1 Tax=Aspergillus uvarum CBS 121591 TaxID=1448315 RepID=A0A319C6S0_9EURO|nr:integral membrane protein [Aspergillus uvarum CBS 121591]PYH81035.1 integral membrane protein [Aspergillus uvarum CBS 121591]